MNNIFLGFIFILFDFTLNFNESTLSLMPAFVGYWFLGKGLVELQGRSESITKAIPLAKFMIVFSAITWLINLFAIQLGLVGTAIGLVETVFSIYVSYLVVVGIKEVEEYHQADLQANKLKQAWLMSTICRLCVGLLIWVPFLILIVIVVAFAIHIYFMVALNNTKKAYYELPPMSSSWNDTNDSGEI